MVKVLHLVEDLKTGGAERVIADIALGLSRKRFNPAVWCISAGGDIARELLSKKMEVRIPGISNYHNPFRIISLARLLGKEKPDIVHTHGYFASVIGRLAARLAGRSILITHVHSTHWEYKKRHLRMERFLSRFTRRIVCCSRAVENFVVGQEGIHPSKTAVVYNGVDEERFSGIPNGSRVRARLGIRPESPVVGTVSSLTAHKGHAYFLRAATKILNAFAETKFLIVGDGPLRPLLEAQAEEDHIKPAVMFLGLRKDIPDLLSAMDVFVLPSSGREGLGIAAIEAMAAEKPVVATNIGGIPEVVRNGMTGLLAPPKNEEALAEAVIQLLKNPEMARHMGKQGKLRVKEKFTLKKMVQEMEKIYENELARKRGLQDEKI